MLSLFNQAGTLARAQIANEPGVIIGPIARVFGYIIDIIFNVVFRLTENHSLGLSIILLTIIVRFLMLPLGIKQQQSTIKMQKLNPEIQKIKSKYGNSKDPEIVKKMNAEQQALYAKHKVNPLSGCLPLLVTMPLFFGLHYIMNQSYLYVDKLNVTYTNLSTAIIQYVPNYPNYVVPLAEKYVPQKMKDAGFDISKPDNMSKVLNRFSSEDWDKFLYQSPKEYSSYAVIQEQGHIPPVSALPAFGIIKTELDRKLAVENFFGLNLIDASGWSWPGVIIPVLVGLTTFLSSWIMGKMQVAADEKQKMQQKVMLYAMPALMLFMTSGLAAGVGIYWITSSLFQTAQQAVLNARAGFPLLKKKEA
jgi:YidC/Oxa1 family membrane protein insertase